MNTEVILGKAGNRLLKVCSGNNVALSRIIEELIAKMTFGELTNLIKKLELGLKGD